MLHHLSIQNYALIDKLEIDFSKGLTIITGETGAGKSILLGALSLILGQRADTNLLYNKNKKCIVEGIFYTEKYGINHFFEKHDLDNDKPTILRREILPTAKSRAFINDTPVSLNQLKELGLLLVDIHSQHETLNLNSSAYQLAIVDAFAQNSYKLDEYKEAYRKYRTTETLLKDLIEKEKKANQDKDYFQFQWEELEKANLSEEEQEELEQESKTLQHVEEIKSQLSIAINSLSNEESNAIALIQEINHAVEKVIPFHGELQSISERINSCRLELDDIANELDTIQNNLHHQPERMEEINERLDIIYSLQHKHRVQDNKQLLEVMDKLSEQLYTISSMEESIVKTQQQLVEQKKIVIQFAENISSKRKGVLSQLETEIQVILTQLGMPNAQLKAKHTPLDDLTLLGKDDISFLFSANKGVVPQPINKVASGGELSRLMFSIKSIIAKRTTLPTIVFDEIDSGVSGEIASKVGWMMQDMAEMMQVMTITHLPQIASKGESHYKVYKTTKGEATEVSLNQLTPNERIDEIAGMLSGKGLTIASKKNAIELLNERRELSSQK